MPSAHIFRYCGSFGRAVTSRLSAHREELAAEPMHMHTCCFFSGALSLQLSPQWSDSLVNCRPLLGCISDRFESKYGFDIGLPAPPRERAGEQRTDLGGRWKGHTGACIDQLHPAPSPAPRPPLWGASSRAPLKNPYLTFAPVCGGPGQTRLTYLTD